MKRKSKKCKIIENGKKCGEEVLAGGMCSKHYQRVYRHGSTEKLQPGAKGELRLRVEKMVKRYRGKDAYYDIRNKLYEEGYDRAKVRNAVWIVLRGDKQKVRSS